MGDSKFLSDLKKYYEDFYSMGIWNDMESTRLIEGKAEVFKRKEYIRYIYEYIFSASCELNDVTKMWCSTNKSIADTARIMNLTTYNAKSQIYYSNKRIKEWVSWRNFNILSYVIFAESITNGDWELLWDKLRHLIFELSPRGVERNQLLINLTRDTVGKNVNDTEWRLFCNMIEPYMVKQRSINQQKINEMSECIAYFNYITTPGMPLNSIDKQRKDKLLEMIKCDGGRKKRKGSKESEKTDGKAKELYDKHDDNDISEMDCPLKTKHVQFWRK